MNRTLRGIRARRGSLLALAAMTAVVVGGTLTVLGFAHAAGTSWTLVVPLLLLGLVAVPSAGRELAAARRDEIGVARLRGLTGPDLVRLIAAEPAAAILVGTLVGLGLGLVGTRLSTAAWLDEAHGPGLEQVLATLAVAAVGVVAVWIGMRRTVVEPLPAQLSASARPTGATAWSSFAAVLVLIAAGVALYRSGVAASDPDGLTLAGPALVGLAAGQVALWAIAGVAAAMVGRTTSGSMPTYLAARRLRRTRDIAGPIRLLVASTVVAALALAGAGAVAAWADDTARLETLGAQRVDLDRSAARALALSHRLDPRGEHLMAGVSIEQAGDPASRRAFLDLARFDAVVGEGLDDTSASAVTDRVPELVDDHLWPGPAVGDTLTVGISGSQRETAGAALAVELEYVDQDGYLQHASARGRSGLPGQPQAVTVPLDGCEDGCWPLALDLSGDGYTALTLSRLEIGRSDLLQIDWVRRESRESVTGPAGITLSPGEIAELEPADAVTPLPVLRSEDLPVPEERATVTTPGGRTRPASVVGRVPALPLLGTTGQLGDLAAVNVGDPTTVPKGRAFVVLAEDTPEELVAAVARAAGRDPQSLDLVRQGALRSAGAEQAPVFVLISLCCLGVAVVVLVASAARQRRTQRVEIAALRVVGVSRDDISRAATIELAVQTTVAVVVALLGGLLATGVLLVNLPILHLPADGLPLQAGVRPVSLLVAGALCALALVLVGRRARAVSVAQTSPALLREEDR